MFVASPGSSVRQNESGLITINKNAELFTMELVLPADNISSVEL